MVSSGSFLLLILRIPESTALEFRLLTDKGSLLRLVAEAGAELGSSVSLAILLNVLVLSLTLTALSSSLLGSASKLSKLTEPSSLSILSLLDTARFPIDFDKDVFLGKGYSENLLGSSVKPESVGDGCCDSMYFCCWLLGALLLLCG